MLKSSSGFFIPLPDGAKLPYPPTLEPTGPAPTLSELDSLQDPPTLKPISESRPLNQLQRRMVSDKELFDKKALQQESQAFTRLLSNNGLNGLALSPADSPASPTLSSVGRRTSVLFKKAKNGVKLQRGLECSLENGEERRQGGQGSPSCPDGERQARKRPQSRTCSDSSGEKSPRQAAQRGEERLDGTLRTWCCWVLGCTRWSQGFFVIDSMVL